MMICTHNYFPLKFDTVYTSCIISSWQLLVGNKSLITPLQCSTGRDWKPLFSTFCAFILWWYMVVGQTLYQNNPPTLGFCHVTFTWKKWWWHQHNSGERFRHRIFLNVWVKVWKRGTVLLLISSICPLSSSRPQPLRHGDRKWWFWRTPGDRHGKWSILVVKP